MFGRGWEETLFWAAVASNVSLTLAIGVEIWNDASVRSIIATVVMLGLSFPWTSWAQTHHLEAVRIRRDDERSMRIAGASTAMADSLAEQPRRMTVSQEAIDAMAEYDRTHVKSRYDVDMETNAGRTDDLWSQ